MNNNGNKNSQNKKIEISLNQIKIQTLANSSNHVKVLSDLKFVHLTLQNSQVNHKC